MLRKWRALIIFFSLVIVMIFAGVGAIYYYTLGLKTVAIQGNQFVTQDEIRQVAGGFQGKNAVVLSALGILDRRLLARLPKIESVDSDYKWPHAIQLTIIEKKPWVVFKSDKDVLISSDGMVLARLAPDHLVQLPSEVVFVRGLNPIYISGNNANPYVLNLLTPLVKGIRQYFPDQVFNLELTGLIVASNGASFEEVVLYKDAVMPIWIGAEYQFLVKLSALRQFLWYIGTEESASPIQYIDLRVPDKVIVGYGSEF